MTPTSQRIPDVLKRDEEERLRQEAAGVRGIFAPFHDDATRSVYDAADVQAGQLAAMRGNPFAAWMGAQVVGLDIAEFAVPGPAWDRGEYGAPTTRYRAL